MTYLLQTHHLTKQKNNKMLINDVNLHVKKGEIYGFLGPNGSGKTTLMKLITNIWKPTSGSIELFGHPLTPKSNNVLQRMGIILEFPVFYDHLSGYNNLKLHCEYMGYYHPNSIEQSLELLDLTEAKDQPVKDYSLGMKERLGIARAIICKPEFLVLDEPTNGLDPAGMKQVRDLLKMLSTDYGITILISSHLLSEIESIADTIGVIQKGKLINEISMKEIEDSNLAYSELTVLNPEKAAFVLSDILHISNFKIFSNNKIRIYDTNISSPELSRRLALNDVDVVSLTVKTETLEDYFLKMTTEVKKS